MREPAIRSAVKNATTPIRYRSGVDRLRERNTTTPARNAAPAACPLGNAYPLTSIKAVEGRGTRRDSFSTFRVRIRPVALKKRATAKRVFFNQRNAISMSMVATINPSVLAILVNINRYVSGDMSYEYTRVLRQTGIFLF